MAEKLVHPNYKMTFNSASGPFDMEFELWTETGLRDPNFWIMFGGVEQDMDQFAEDQLRRAGQYVEDWRAPGGH